MATTQAVLDDVETDSPPTVTQQNSSDVPDVAERVGKVVDQVEKVIVGKRGAVELAMVAILSGGHVLIEDIPGVGKTTLAKGLAKALGCTFRRVQFTPDLLPSDITGTSVFNQRNGSFEFREGPIFSNIVLADEINRATPKAQSSLLECMEESQISADGVTHILPRPFLVIATENNIEAQGTFPLPEAQLDRFLIKMRIGYPDRQDEADILGMQSGVHPIDQIHPILNAEQIVALQGHVRTIYVAAALRHYIVDIVSATREHPNIQLGASPRGSLALLHSSQALAALRGRTYVIADDIKELAVPVLSHRMILRPESRLKFADPVRIIEDILTSTRTPDAG